jgi:hypothetical protein
MGVQVLDFEARDAWERLAFAGLESRVPTLADNSITVAYRTARRSENSCQPVYIPAAMRSNRSMPERTPRFQTSAEGAARSALLIAGATFAAEIGKAIVGGLLGRHGHLDWFTAFKAAALLGLASYAILFFYLLFGIRADRPQKAHPAPARGRQGIPLAGFAAMEYFWLLLNRTILVFFQPEGLYGWTVHGPVACLRPRYFQRYADRLEDPEAIDFPEVIQRLAGLRKGGFFIPREEIVSAQLIPKRKWGMGPIPHSGRIELRLATGERREFILLGSVDPEAIQKRILE